MNRLPARRAGATPLARGAPPRVPAHLAPYVDVMGAELTVAFLRTFGGVGRVFTSNPRPDTELVDMIGLDRARALGERLGPVATRVPLGKVWVARWLRWNGASTSAIARHLHVTDVTVRAYLAAEGARRMR